MGRFGSAAAALAAGVFCAAAQAEPAAPAPATAPPAPIQAHALTADDLDAFLDGYMPLALGRGDIAGAVVVVVKDGQVLFEKGYGVSNVKHQSPVDPKTTMFRPGSVSKLFTWTAVMQQVEQKKLDLDADVNTYLDFKIPPYEGKPVTLRNLMTHTPGFEETEKNLFTTDPKNIPSLGAALKANIPARVFPPGEVPAYSNYGAALAGYIVERVSGEPFADYVARHIFVPLNMRHSTFTQPLPDDLSRDMSKGYDKASGKVQPYEIIPMSPAGALAASGDDMAHFMIAHLNNGSYPGGHILEPQTATLMHGVAYQHTPDVPPMAYGFYHEDRNGHVIVGHGGDTLWFHSDLHLILDQNVGLFVSQNSQGKPQSGLRGPLFKGFMDRYFPAPPLPKETTLKTAKADGALAAGDYIVSRGSFTNLVSIASLFSQATVSVNDDNTISVNLLTDMAGNPKRLHEVRPFVWREVHGRDLLIAKTKDGKVTEIVSDAVPQILALNRAPWWQSQKINLPLFAGMLGMLALTVIFWPLKAILRWRYDSPFPLSGRSATLYRLTRLVALCNLIAWCGLLGWLSYAANNHLELLSASHDWILRTFQVFGLIGTIGVIAPILNVGEAVSDAARPWWTKGTDLLIAAACIVSIWYAVTQHLFSLSLNF
jgi:CubicO group peptidase (beta-lactamase class C family)